MKKSNLTPSKFFVSLLVSVVVSLAAAMPTFAAEKAAETKQANMEVQAESSISINQASADELASLKGIGEKKAQAIVEYRNANGEFASVEQLSEVKGISDKTIAANKARLTL